MIEVKELPVVPKIWEFRLRNDRNDRRCRAPEQTIARWLKRYASRTRDTVTGAPTVTVSADHADYFIRNERLLLIRIPRLVGGQDFGLPPLLQMDAQMLSFETIDGKYVSRTEMWERGLTGG